MKDLEGETILAALLALAGCVLWDSGGGWLIFIAICLLLA